MPAAVMITCSDKEHDRARVSTAYVVYLAYSVQAMCKPCARSVHMGHCQCCATVLLTKFGASLFVRSKDKYCTQYDMEAIVRSLKSHNHAYSLV